jgi:hypothetical protein
MTRTRFTAAAAGMILTAAVLLSGCSGSDDAGGTAQPMSEGAAGDTAARPNDGRSGDQDGKTTPGGDSQPTITRSIVRTGYLTIEAADLTRTRQKLGTIVAGLRGLIASENSSTDANGNIPRNELVIRVPSASYDVAVRRLSEELGKVTQIRQESADVTEQVVDVESRIATQRAGLNRMRALLAKANTIGEIVSVEGELTRREADLESLLAKQKALAGQTELATITVTLAKPGEAPKPPEDKRGFLVGLRSGWDAFSGTVSALATVAGAVLPFGIALALIVVPVWYFVRRTRREPAAPASPDPQV